eukprot:CAMPEP_0114614858 /NCGR_PEP_ID=MMETSP0168-20121206/5869_1 /TAXON_ID=95228 ORGANISM="Vannella sp., Strain DIVA3 517/6/12" /NCGR_SAMPLE_ID=MMETSP0168 /ASSEMBLY_ACC=CAM_ASM_000044 /LENGTH=245 /DNA_ID=CAMNT_0001825917 /DNA_START=23 /DNA_END=760 /DNA_ORIENTATION=+
MASATGTENPWKGLFAQTPAEPDTDFFFFDDLANSNLAVNLGYPGANNQTGQNPSLPDQGSFAAAEDEVESSRRVSGRKRKAAAPEPAQKRARSSSDEDYGDEDDDDMDIEQKKAAIRKARNRKAAKDFRRRQKKKVEDIVNTNKELEKKNEELETKLKIANNENDVMKEQLNYLRSFVSRVMQAALPAMAAQQLSFPSMKAGKELGKDQSQPAGMITAGMLGGSLGGNLSVKEMESALGLTPRS